MAEVKILVIDDEDVIRTTLADYLVTMGYKVSTARDGVEGLDIFTADTDYNLVLLDMVMPQMDGRECLERLRGLDPDLKVIITTGYTSNTDAGCFGKIKPDAIVPKPVTCSSLGKVLEDVLFSQGE